MYVLWLQLLYDQDKAMYHAAEDVPCTSRTTTLNEELGQVLGSYVMCHLSLTMTMFFFQQLIELLPKALSCIDVAVGRGWFCCCRELMQVVVN
jgi:hypothetical protein